MKEYTNSEFVTNLREECEVLDALLHTTTLYGENIDNFTSDRFRYLLNAIGNKTARSILSGQYVEYFDKIVEYDFSMTKFVNLYAGTKNIGDRFQFTKSVLRKIQKKMQVFFVREYYLNKDDPKYYMDKEFDKLFPYKSSKPVTRELQRINRNIGNDERSVVTQRKKLETLENKVDIMNALALRLNIPDLDREELIEKINGVFMDARKQYPEYFKDTRSNSSFYHSITDMMNTLLLNIEKQSEKYYGIRVRRMIENFNSSLIEKSKKYKRQISILKKEAPGIKYIIEKEHLIMKQEYLNKMYNFDMVK